MPALGIIRLQSDKWAERFSGWTWSAVRRHLVLREWPCPVPRICAQSTPLTGQLAKEGNMAKPGTAAAKRKSSAFWRIGTMLTGSLLASAIAGRVPTLVNNDSNSAQLSQLSNAALEQHSQLLAQSGESGLAQFVQSLAAERTARFTRRSAPFTAKLPSKEVAGREFRRGLKSVGSCAGDTFFRLSRDSRCCCC